MKKQIPLGDRIRNVIRIHEKQTGEIVSSIKVHKERAVGFNQKESTIVNYWTK